MIRLCRFTARGGPLRTPSGLAIRKSVPCLDILEAIPVYTSSILLGYISLIPLGTGVVEGSLTIFLQNHGVELSAALTAPIIIRLFTRWVIICVGFFALKYNDGFKILKEL